MFDSDPASSKPKLHQVIASVLAAAFGVQSNANRERDFSHGSAKVYIIAGVIFTVLFVFTLVMIVRLIVG